MRADAAARRARILEAARRIVAARGERVPLEAVAESAGVGIATLYRNFGSREELLEGVAVAVIDDLRGAVERAHASGRRDADCWRGLLGDFAALEFGVFAGLGSVAEAPAVSGAQTEALEELSALMESFSGAGVIRGDLAAEDVVVGLAIITRPQPGAAAASAPAIVDSLVEAFADWTLGH